MKSQRDLHPRRWWPHGEKEDGDAHAAVEGGFLCELRSPRGVLVTAAWPEFLVFVALAWFFGHALVLSLKVAVEES